MKHVTLLKKQFLSVLLALAMVIGTLPVMTTKAYADTTYYYLDMSDPSSPTTLSGSGTVLTSSSTTTTWQTGTYIAQGDVTFTGIIKLEFGK